MLVRRCDLAKVTDINVIGTEECLKQHKLLVCKIDLHESVKKTKKKFVGRHKVWRLRETEIRKDFAERVRYREERMEEGDVESMWKRSEEHTSELQSLAYLVCRLLLEKKK